MTPLSDIHASRLIKALAIQLLMKNLLIALLPDGRKFGQITKKQAPKSVHCRRKLVAGKLQNCFLFT
jgi:hypothetical protein